MYPCGMNGDYMAKPSPKKSRSRYRPEKKSFPDIIIKERDIEIMKFLFEHRFLDTELIWHLLESKTDCTEKSLIGKDGKKRPVKYGFGIKALYKRLQTLFHNKYVARHFITDEPLGRGTGSPRAIYGLGSASAKVLPDIVGFSPDRIRRIVEANKVKSPFLRHALDIARFRATLELACRESNGYIELICWKQGQELGDFVMGKNLDGRTIKFSVYPDAFFVLSVKDRGNSHFFLEVDRGSMPIIAKKDRPDISRKVLGYSYYRSSKKYTARYRYLKFKEYKTDTILVLTGDTSNPAKNSEPIKGFTVLFLVPGRLTESNKPEGRLKNILDRFPEFGKDIVTSSIFWFAPHNAFTVSRPASIFAKIWKIPNPIKEDQSLII